MQPEVYPELLEKNPTNSIYATLEFLASNNAKVASHLHSFWYQKHYMGKRQTQTCIERHLK